MNFNVSCDDEDLNPNDDKKIEGSLIINDPEAKLLQI